MKQDLISLPQAPSAHPEGEVSRLGRQPVRRRRLSLWIGAAVLFLIVVIVAASHSTKASAAKSKAANPPMPVVVDDVTKGDMPVYITGLGTVTPLYTVTVKTRVDGQLMKVLYREGQNVRKGDPLVEIDPRPFEVQLQQAAAQLAKDQAALQNARADLERYQTLIKRKAVAAQVLSTQEATVAQDAAVVKADEANIANAKLNISYCHITSPVTGRVGLRLVDPGNMVSAASSTPLAVVTQMQPMSVLFTIPEQYVEPILERARKATLVVDAIDGEMKTTVAAGELSTTDNEIDPSTGTLKMRAVYPNKDEKLFPNQFVNARLLLETHNGVPLVPDAAIQRNTNNIFVYVTKPDNTVTIRNITIGASNADQTEVVSGLDPGEVVVTQGVDRLAEGSKVVAQHSSPAPNNGSQGSGAQQPTGGGRQGRRGQANQ